jgi:hypothetical protein
VAGEGADVGTRVRPPSARVAGLRQAARWCLAGIVIEAVAVLTDITFRMSWLAVAGSIVQALTLSVLIWRLDLLLPRTGASAMLAVVLGTTAMVLWPLSIAGGRVAQVLTVFVPVALAVFGAWLIALGRSRTRLPPPLPRRAVVGGVGYLLLVAWWFAASLALSWLILAVAIVCAVSVLGLVFGLIDLDRLTSTPSA